MLAYILPNGNWMIPARGEGEGIVGDAMIEVPSDHPEARKWQEWHKAQSDSITQQDLLAAASNPPRELSQEDYAAYLAHLYGQWEDAGSQGAGEDGGEKDSGNKPGKKAEESGSEQDPRP